MDWSECLIKDDRSEWEQEASFTRFMDCAPNVTRNKLIRNAESGYLFLLADGKYLSVRDANWCDGILSKEDVGKAVQVLERSPHRPGSLRSTVAHQHRFIQMASEVNWECGANPTPERIVDVRDTWREFCGFLDSQVNQLKS